MIISIDPSGTSTTSCFLFSDWNKYEFRSFTDKDWLNHAEFIQKLIKKEKPEVIIYENVSFLKFANYHFKNLLKVIAIIELLCHEKQINRQAIVDKYTKWVEVKIKQDKILGLKYEKRKYYFRDKLLTHDEKNTLLCFYIYWTKIAKKNWLPA
ncbi:hypothetical protein [endosymbiont GvMRE of Glomus versiforme]|uniref:hypothetical protein n=1 Tax=endosymbiont GvMRE of Glomus versiforme TaxID=2039283 RepID=UPI000EBD4062|nr:hypothetical protein [endosymbiont GvMRE of Glomus versiforme]RHZ37230.1 hypothetical protein GvMRE_I1g261 [endosymbiont GvMRE of Glomus versiforme]